MRVLVDTSAWADFLNAYPSSEGQALAELIAGEDEICTCGVIVAEVFQGLHRDRACADLRRFFRKLTFLEASGIDPYLHASEIYRSLRKRGYTVRSTIDCLIAVIAQVNGCYVLARDRDMEAILRSGVVTARPWPL